MLLRDKVVIVSGVGPGLGRELALLAGREGARVVLAARTEPFLEEVGAQLAAAGGESLAVPTDITSRDQCQRLVQATLARFGRIDALINSAYTIGRVMPFEEADLERWRVPIKVNLFGSLQLSQQVIAPMKAQDGGAIVMVGSITARKPMLNDTAYAASRGVPEREIEREFAARMALPEIPRDADCAGAVLFLASDYARAITGATLDVNGGEWMP